MSLYLAGEGRNCMKVFKPGQLGHDQSLQVRKLLYLDKEKLAPTKLQDSSLMRMTGTTVGPAVTIIK